MLYSDHEWNPGMMDSSSGSNWSCSIAGKGYGEEGCTHCRWAAWCEARTSVSRAPLCSLPEYMASGYVDVRRAARARFDELQELPEPSIV